nr:MAG TPA: hypothetical protein [Caudoviricetes sp.]
MIDSAFFDSHQLSRPKIACCPSCRVDYNVFAVLSQGCLVSYWRVLIDSFNIYLDHVCNPLPPMRPDSQQRINH